MVELLCEKDVRSRADYRCGCITLGYSDIWHQVSGEVKDLGVPYIATSV